MTIFAEELRVAMISIHSCPLAHLGGRDTGGMNVYIRCLSRELARCGVKVDIFTRHHDHGEEATCRLPAATQLIHLGTNGVGNIAKGDLYHHLPQLTHRMRASLAAGSASYDLIHSHYWLSGWMAEQIKTECGVPHLATFHTLGLIKNHIGLGEIEPPLRTDTEGKVIVAAEGVLAFSQEERQQMATLYGAEPQKVAVVPCGVDAALFYPRNKAQARHRLGLGQGHILLFVGRIDPLKGLHLLLSAVAQLKHRQNWQLLVIGGDRQDQEVGQLQQQAKQMGLGDRVSFLGQVDHEMLPHYYSASDVCIVPSYYESFGLVAVEALACGTPVVASRVGGLAITVKDGETGYLVAEPSPQAFARKLEQLLDDEPLRLKFALAAPASVERYHWPGIARQVLEVYLSLADSGCGNHVAQPRQMSSHCKGRQSCATLIKCRPG